jgi:hypothetical protein
MENTQSELDKKVSEFINALRQNGLADKPYVNHYYSDKKGYEYIGFKFYEGAGFNEVYIYENFTPNDIHRVVEKVKYMHNTEQVTEQVENDNDRKIRIEKERDLKRLGHFDKFTKPNYTEQALKFDEGKLDWELLDFSLFEDVVKVLMFGAKKYERNNWRKGHYTIQIFNALLRHLFAYIRGEDIDKESGLSHLGHCGACLMFLIYNTNTKFDNRSKNEKVN